MEEFEKNNTDSDLGNNTLLQKLKVFAVKYRVLLIASAVLILIAVIVLLIVFCNNRKNENNSAQKSNLYTQTTTTTITTTTQKSEEIGIISGDVLDTNNKLIKNADIIISNKLTTRKYEYMSDYKGEYSAELPIGIYTVTVNAEGYEQAKIYNVEVKNSKETSLKNKIHLEIKIDYENIYYDYIENTLINKYGLAGMNKYTLTSDGLYGSIHHAPDEIFGLVSADIFDYDSDKIPDLLITRHSQNDTDYIWTLELYSYENNEVKLKNTYTYNQDRIRCYFNFMTPISVQRIPGYIILRSTFTFYEGTTTDYILLSAKDFKEIKNYECISYGGYTLELFGENLTDNKFSYNPDSTYEENLKRQVVYIESLIENQLNELGIKTDSVSLEYGIDVEYKNSTDITHYDYSSDCIIPSDKTELREKLGIDYSTSIIKGPDIEPATYPSFEDETDTNYVEDNEYVYEEDTEELTLEETVYYDTNGDGTEETIELYNTSASSWLYKIYYSNGTVKEYEKEFTGNSLTDYIILKDNNINKTYIAFIESAGGGTYYYFYITNAEMNIEISRNSSYESETTHTYSIDGKIVGKDEFINYLSNVEVLYPSKHLNVISNEIESISLYNN